MKKSAIIFVFIFTLIIIISGVFFAYKLSETNDAANANDKTDNKQINNFLETQANEDNSDQCRADMKKYIVRGNSLEGFIDDGRVVNALMNYYACHEPKRNDVVLYNYAGNPEPIIKIIKAVPGDRWNLKQTNQGFEIMVNDTVLTNNSGGNYVINVQNSKMLSLYTKDYPIIPSDTYLILGNLTEGSLDSTKFGLVSKNDIVGKVMY